MPGKGPQPAAFRRSGGEADLYCLWLDEMAGLVRGEARVCWSTAETDLYIEDLGRFVIDSRRRLGKVRVLLDRRDISIQSADVAARLAEANRTIFVGDDRVALVVDSSLMKMSLRQRMPHAGTKAFLSIDAAETWLKA